MSPVKPTLSSGGDPKVGIIASIEGKLERSTIN